MPLTAAARFVESRPVLLVTLCSALFVWPVRRVRVLNVLAAVAIPGALAYIVYWLPVWLVPPDPTSVNDLHRLDMHGAWAFLAEAEMFVPAAFVSSLLVAAAAWRARRAQRRAGPPPSAPSPRQEGPAGAESR